MLPLLINLIIILLVLGVVYWICTLLPLPHPFPLIYPGRVRRHRVDRGGRPSDGPFGRKAVAAVIVTEHFPVGKHCVHCGAYAPDGKVNEGLSCRPRNDGFRQNELMPEPARRPIACEDADLIVSRIAEIRAEAEPRCPTTPHRLLHECLRSAAPCTDACELKHDWIGPQ